MSEPPPGIVRRHLEDAVRELLQEEPVLILNGARTVGKSTLMRACATRAGVRVLDLDDLETRAAVLADPTLFVSSSAEPVCIDEYQHVRPLLDAIKAELNRDLRPGRYLLTGSTRYASLPRASQSLAGRAHVVTMWPLSQGELRGRKETFLDTLMSDPNQLVRLTASSTTREEYESVVLRGGFPLALQRENGARARWFGDLVNLVIERDVLQIRKVRQRNVLPQILQRLAGQTGQLLVTAKVASLLGLDGKTVGDFIQLLESVFLVHRLEAYGRTLSSRVVHAPKVHMVDSGLAAYLLRITPQRLAARSPATLTEFGHVLETFAINEVLKQAGWAKASVTFSHFRTRDGQEVDLVCETGDGRVAGLEIKSAGNVTSADVSGLRTLRTKMGEDFAAGVVLYLGQLSYTLEDRIHAVPLDALWN